MRELAARRDPSKLSMTPAARALFDELSKQVLSIDGNVIELTEQASVSYHAGAFFLEAIPRKQRLTLLLALEFNELQDDGGGIAEDTSQWKFITHAAHDAGVMANITRPDEILAVLPLIRQAHALASA